MFCLPPFALPPIVSIAGEPRQLKNSSETKSDHRFISQARRVTQ
jgi:hypothetical protein